MISASQDAVVYEVLGLRALNAARSGLEEVVLRVFATQTINPLNCQSGTVANTNFGTLQGLENCYVDYVCTVNNVDGTDYFRFDSRGTCTQADIIVSRTVSIDGKNLASTGI